MVGYSRGVDEDEKENVLQERSIELLRPNRLHGRKALRPMSLAIRQDLQNSLSSFETYKRQTETL